ncbi:MAG TPA: DoxX family protein [Burkholderiales bacterium]|nr:DoxX family protein [Burkholderiales bacterium]
MGELSGWNAGLADWASLALRLAVGCGSFVHAKNKFRKVHLFAAGHHLPIWLAWVATFVQLLGGIALILGLGTPIAALGLTIFGLWATLELVFRKREKFAAPGEHTWDTGVMYTAIPLAILLTGPGRYSLDHLLAAR